MNRTMAIYSLIVVILIIFILDESPRFLATKERYEELQKVLNKIAKFNGNSEIAFDIAMLEKNRESGEVYIESTENLDLDTNNQNKSISKYQEIWSPRTNLLKTGIFIYLWLALNLIYYGISLGITNIDTQVNSYIMYLLSRFGYVSFCFF